MKRKMKVYLDTSVISVLFDKKNPETFQTTEIYTHVSKKSIGKIVSPLDNLEMRRGDK